MVATAKQRNAMAGVTVDSYTHRDSASIEKLIRDKVDRELAAMEHVHDFGKVGRCWCGRHREPARVSP